MTKNLDESVNGTEVEHTRKNISYSEDKESVTVDYAASNIDPQLECIFTADILDHFNHSKAKNESYFGEYNILNELI